MKTSKLVDHIFREEYGKLVAIMLHKFGTNQLENIEDALQEALVKAMTLWSYNEIPKNPSAWLLKVAGNQLIDSLRKDRKTLLDDDSFSFLEKIQTNPEQVLVGNQIEDQQLKMIFACCHPSLSEEYQIILSLKLISGFSNKELAKALLKKEETIAKSFTRAKKRFKEQVTNLKIPLEIGLKSRLNIVLKILYVLFTEGYKKTSGEIIIKKDICFEALRLALLLIENKYCKQSSVYALIALMCFHASRFDARVDEHNEIVDLEHQDRSLYNEELMLIGDYHLTIATNMSDSPSEYHFQAAIAFHHCVAKSFQETDWSSILEFYDLQLKHFYSPTVVLNRVIPYAKIHGAELALKELQDLESKSFFTETVLFYVIKAEIYLQLANKDKFKVFLESAISMSTNVLEKSYLTKKLTVAL